MQDEGKRNNQDLNSLHVKSLEKARDTKEIDSGDPVSGTPGRGVGDPPPPKLTRTLRVTDGLGDRQERERHSC